MFNFYRNYEPDKLAKAEKLVQAFHEFEKKFPTEKESVELFANLVLEEIGVYCRFCSSTSIVRDYGSRFYRCSQCRRKGWIFTGTFFEKMRLAKLWNATIWLYERKVKFNAWQLANLCQVAYSSALVINRKIAKVIHFLQSQHAEWVPSGVFMKLFCKRSKVTPANEHPKFEQIKMDDSLLAEQTEGEEESNIRTDEINELINKLTQDEHQILALLSETPLHLDDICRKFLSESGATIASLTMLELNDLVVRHPGDYYTKSATPKKFSRDIKARQDLINQYLNSKKVEEFVNYAIYNFHGFSRKYLQFYIAKFQAAFQEGFMAPGKLLQECLRQESFSYSQMLEYVSPSEVAFLI